MIIRLFVRRARLGPWASERRAVHHHQAKVLISVPWALKIGARKLEKWTSLCLVIINSPSSISLPYYSICLSLSLGNHHQHVPKAHCILFIVSQRLGEKYTVDIVNLFVFERQKVTDKLGLLKRYWMSLLFSPQALYFS